MERYYGKGSGPGNGQLLKVIIGDKIFYTQLQTHTEGTSYDQSAEIVGTIQAKSSTPLGTPYSQHQDVSKNKVWFVNTKTGESVKKLPKDGFTQGTTIYHGRTNVSDDDDDTVETWTKQTDGKDTWYVSSKGESKWVLPEGAVLAQAGGKRSRHTTRKAKAKKSKKTRRMKGGGWLNSLRFTEKTSKKISDKIDQYLDVIGNPNIHNTYHPGNEENVYTYIYMQLKKKCYFGETTNCEIKFLNDKVQVFNVFDKYILQFKGTPEQDELVRRINFLREQFPAIKVLFDSYMPLQGYDATVTSKFTDLNPSALTPEILATLDQKPAKQ